MLRWTPAQGSEWLSKQVGFAVSSSKLEQTMDGDLMRMSECELGEIGVPEEVRAKVLDALANVRRESFEGWVERRERAPFPSNLTQNFKWFHCYLVFEPGQALLHFYTDAKKRKCLFPSQVVVDMVDGGEDPRSNRPSRHILLLEVGKKRSSTERGLATIDKAPVQRKRSFTTFGSGQNRDKICVACISKDDKQKWANLLRGQGVGTPADDDSLVKVDNRAPHILPLSSIEFGTRIGQGAQGSVYKGKWAGTAVAIKQIQIPREMAEMDQQSIIDELETEVKLLTNLEHPFIERFYGIASSGQTEQTSVYLITDIYPLTLLDLIYKPGVLQQWTDPEIYVSLASQLAEGIGYLHRRGILHRDIKPDNVFIAEDRSSETAGETASANASANASSGGGNKNQSATQRNTADATDAVADAPQACPYSVKLGDFGMSKIVQSNDSFADHLEQQVLQQTKMVGTPIYMAPEMIMECEEMYDYAVDVFSLGLVFWAMYTGKQPWLGSGINPMKLMMGVCHGMRPQIPETMPPTLERLIRECWDADSRLRPTCEDIVRRLAEGRAAIHSEHMTTVNSVKVGAARGWRKLRMAGRLLGTMRTSSYMAGQGQGALERDGDLPEEYLLFKEQRADVRMGPCETAVRRLSLAEETQHPLPRKVTEGVLVIYGVEGWVATCFIRQCLEIVGQHPSYRSFFKYRYIQVTHTDLSLEAYQQLTPTGKLPVLVHPDARVLGGQPVAGLLACFDYLHSAFPDAQLLAPSVQSSVQPALASPSAGSSSSSSSNSRDSAESSCTTTTTSSSISYSSEGSGGAVGAKATPHKRSGSGFLSLGRRLSRGGSEDSGSSSSEAPASAPAPAPAPASASALAAWPSSKPDVQFMRDLVDLNDYLRLTVLNIYKEVGVAHPDDPPDVSLDKLHAQQLLAEQLGAMVGSTVAALVLSPVQAAHEHSSHAIAMTSVYQDLYWDGQLQANEKAKQKAKAKAKESGASTQSSPQLQFCTASDRLLFWIVGMRVQMGPGFFEHEQHRHSQHLYDQMQQDPIVQAVWPVSWVEGYQNKDDMALMQLFKAIKRYEADRKAQGQLPAVRLVK